MSNTMFDRLRALVLATNGSLVDSIADQSDLVPIEQTTDGWFCLRRDGQVLHVDRVGDNGEVIVASDRGTALIGNLALRFPIATWFLPRSDRAEPCPACNGTGRVPGISENAGARIVCRCGGLGWAPVSLHSGST